MTHNTTAGHSYPLGATVTPTGVNFSLYAKKATAIELLLFESAEDAEPFQVIFLDPLHHKTFYYWHIFVEGIGSEQIYAYRVYGPHDPEKGLRYEPQKVLLDPYTRAVAGWHNYQREAAIKMGNNCAHALRSVVVDASLYDWEDDQPLKIPYASSVIYELHVGGFTRHPSAGIAQEKQGTFAGVIEKIPYLQDLGITAVELLPVHQFDEQDAPVGLENYWGYSTMAFFAPHTGYSSRRDPLGPVDEFRDMVKALHKAGIEVILDVVFNHTAEGNHQGPTFSFKGLDNSAYYILDRNPAYYSNYSGCGNTLNANHEIVARMILDSLRYWVSEMHVDGFRFDLAAVLSRSRSGEPLTDPPILWDIESDPVLAGTKIIAEAWDAAGLYQVGSFIGDRFAEWNGPFRDCVRRFVKGEKGMVRQLAARLLGSPDIYPKPDREPNRSIHFVTCHDGFTLNDLVSYNQKHNDNNQENNRDGSNDNYSWNCGIEGETEDPDIETLRQKQIKNFLTILFLSQGTPMLLMGDEIRNSHQGNNNVYCQNNKISWFNWNQLEEQAELQRFVKELIQFIQSYELFKQEKILSTRSDRHQPFLTWHGVNLGQPDWSENSHSLAMNLQYPDYQEHIHLMLNAYWQPLRFQLPKLKGVQEQWCRIIDTANSAPQDFCIPSQAPTVETDFYEVSARSVVAVWAR